MRPSKRLEQIPPYLFAELERKIADKKAAGIDVISLGIGDPDTPTYPAIVAAAQQAVADPSTHQYPSNRGRQEFREAVAAFYRRRFGVELDPDTEVMPAIGAKECIFNLNLAFLDPGRRGAGLRSRLSGLHRRPADGRRHAPSDGARARAGIRPGLRRDRRRGPGPRPG